MISDYKNRVVSFRVQSQDVTVFVPQWAKPKTHTERTDKVGRSQSVSLSGEVSVDLFVCKQVNGVWLTHNRTGYILPVDLQVEVVDKSPNVFYAPLQPGASKPQLFSEGYLSEEGTWLAK